MQQQDVFFTILDKWEADGEPAWVKVQQVWLDACNIAHRWTLQELEHYFRTVVYPKLKLHRVSTGPIYTDDYIDYGYWNYFQEWDNIAQLGNCYIKNPYTLDSYPTLSVRTIRNSSSNLFLYQIPARIEEFNQNPLQRINWGKEYVASHLCHTKQCLVCAIKEPRSYNTHRNFCVAFTLMDGILVWTCQHEPKCRNFGPTAFPEDIIK